ncbi:MAG: hypothetical protein ACRDYY_12820 [Acidimicrobiales bacterium]
MVDNLATVDVGALAASVTLPREVRESCSVALRRMGEMVVSSVAVTSTSGKEGRTSVAVGLATAAALELHRSTVVLDLDFTRGGVGKIFSACPGPGAADILFAGSRIERCVQDLGNRIAVVTAGDGEARKDVPLPLDRLALMIEELRAQCDILIADLPPLSDGVATVRIADLFDSVVLVVRAGRSPLNEVGDAASLLSQKPVVVLNGTENTGRSLLSRVLRTR